MKLFGFFELPIAMPFFNFVGTTAAIIGGGLLAAGGSIAGAAINSSAQDDASAAAEKSQREALAQQERLAREGMAYQERQANAALDFQKQQYADAQAQLAPYAAMQLKATQGLEAFADPNNPIYQAQRQQMTEAIQRQLAAQGLLRSREQVDNLGNIELGLSQQRLGVQQGLAGLGAGQGLASLAQAYGGNVAQIRGQLGANVGSQFSGMGQNAMAAGQSLAQLNSQRILAGAQNNANLITGLGNVFQNTLSGFNNIQQAQANQAFQQKLLGGLGGGNSLFNPNSFVDQSNLASLLKIGRTA